MKRLQAPSQAFAGRWRIISMETWPDDYLDLIERAHVTFQNDSDGELVFGAVKAWLDLRYGERDGAPLAEFSWEGMNDADPACGRGWASLGPTRCLAGHFYIHGSDDSAFIAERE